MIFEHSHINYAKKYEIVNDGRILKALKNRGFFNSYDKQFKYIDGDYTKTSIYYNSNEYQIKYFDGCFNPFIIKII